MASSDAYANGVLLREVSRGGSGWFRLLDAAPSDDLSTFSVADEIPPVELPYDGVATWVVAGRQANPVDPIVPDTSGVTVTVTPLGWALFEDEACTLPEIGGRLADVKVTPGSTVVVPAATVTIRFPASVADLL